MFKLTDQEQKMIAFLVAVLLLGVAVRQWRVRHPKPAPAPSEARGH